jgi:hypothetical protein
VLVLVLSGAIQGVIKSVAIDICYMAVVAMVWYILRETPLGTSTLLIPFLLGKLAYVGIIVFIGLTMLEIGDKIAPFAGSEITKRYRGKRVVNWNGLVRTVVSIIVLTMMWVVLSTSFQSLAGSVTFLIDSNALILTYNLFFVVVLAYTGIVGTMQSRSPGSTQSIAIGNASWPGLGQAAKVSQYLKRLEVLRSSRQIDEVMYKKLHDEYEQKLRETIESP